MVWGYKAAHKSCQCSSPQSLAKGPGGRELGFSWASRVWSGMNFPEVYTSVQQEEEMWWTRQGCLGALSLWGDYEALSSPVPRPTPRPPLLSCHYSNIFCAVCAQPCLTLCDPMDCSPLGSLVHGDSPGKNTGVGCHALLQGIFPTQVSCIKADSSLSESPGKQMANNGLRYFFSHL